MIKMLIEASFSKFCNVTWQQLDDLDEYYINIDPREDNLEPHHQGMKFIILSGIHLFYSVYA